MDVAGVYAIQLRPLYVIVVLHSACTTYTAESHRTQMQQLSKRMKPGVIPEVVHTASGG